MVVINAGNTSQEVVIPRGAYNIETIIAMLNVSEAFMFELSVRVKGLDNPRCYFLSTVCNQVVVTNGTVLHDLSMPQGYYYKFSKFIEAVR